jgi:hypothetical protein
VPLIELYFLLYKDELNLLFWYSFHSDDCVMILRRLSEYSDPRSRAYFHLRKVFRVACAVFSQSSKDIWYEYQHSLDWER